MSEREDTSLVAAGAALVVLIAGVVSRAYAVWLLWGWFVVPLGVPPIGLAHAYGLHLFGSAVRSVGSADRQAAVEEHRRSRESRAQQWRSVGLAAAGVTGTWILVGIAAAVHAWGMQ